MRDGWRRLFAGLVILLLCRGTATADAEAAWAALRAGGHVALMRHALAPGGAGDPPGFQLEDCATQRNLSAEGRAQAVAIGAAVKAAGVTFDRIVSSPWCRCLETARLLGLGVVEADPAFSNVFVLSDQRQEIVAADVSITAGWKGPGNLLVVTHGANITGMTGISPASGEIVVVRPNGDRTLREIGSIPPPT